jgi:hypothetical protein
MQIPSVNRLQQITETVTLSDGSEDQLAFFDSNIHRRARGHLCLDGKRPRDSKS